MTPTPEATVDPSTIVIDSAKTAGDMLVMACKGDMQTLAQAMAIPEGHTFTVNINLKLVFTRDDVHRVLREAGFDFTLHAKPGAQS